MADLDRIRDLTNDQREAETVYLQQQRILNEKLRVLRCYLAGLIPSVIMIIVLIDSQAALVPLAIAGICMLGYLHKSGSTEDTDVLKRRVRESKERFEHARDALTRELSQWD